MQSAMARREFLQSTAGVVAAASLAQAAHSAERVSANDTIVVGVMGVNGRGSALARGFASQKGVEVAYICDVDSRAIGKAKANMADRTSREPQGVGDFRRILDDSSVDALVVATPNHWHAPATILGCAAGKHVYVEKPCSHNPHEGELMVAASRKHNRIVQLGTQRRSWPGIIEAMDKLHSGDIGKVNFSRCWYNNRRASIGHGKPAQVPSWLDYSLWQGPAPEIPYRDNLIHYNWHWFWHWGNGELGNNGVHALDVSRWGLQVDFPTRVVSGGGRYRFDDDQETFDTHIVTYEFGDKAITWEGLSWSPHGFEGEMFGMNFYGDKGTMVVTGAGYAIYDMKDRKMSDSAGPGGDAVHINNFLECVRTGKLPHADIEQGHKTTLLCHLGNIAQRTGDTLNIDSENGHILNNPAAQQLWRREYRPGWEPIV